MLVYARFDHGAISALPRLRAAGAQTISASRRYQTATLAAKPGQLEALGRVPRVESVSEVPAPLSAAGEECPSGEVVSEGDAQLNADTARAEAPKPDGSGVTVGILSDSFAQATEAVGGGELATTAADDIASGDLPGEANPCGYTEDVEVRSEAKEDEEEGPFDEGRAMAQIVHDLAPGASLKFASAFNGELDFAQSIEDMAAPEGSGGGGADVIADDVFYLEEPFFQDGPVAAAVNEAVADGTTYFSAAGNDNLVDSEGNEIGSWETPKFRNAGSCPPSVAAKPGFQGSCLDFNPGAAVDKTFGIKVEAGATLTVDLQWDEPWLDVGTDLDAFLLNATGTVIAESRRENAATGKPVEWFSWDNESGSTKTVQFVVNRFSGGDPGLKFALIENGGGVEGTEYPRSSGGDVVGPTIFGHSGSSGAISVGADPLLSRIGSAGTRGLLFPGPGSPRFRTGDRRGICSVATGVTRRTLQARSHGDRLRAYDLLRRIRQIQQIRTEALDLLRHLGVGTSRSRGGGADVGCRRIGGSGRSARSPLCERGRSRIRLICGLRRWRRPGRRRRRGLRPSIARRRRRPHLRTAGRTSNSRRSGRSWQLGH